MAAYLHEAESSDDDDLLQMYDELYHKKIPRIIKDRSNPFEEYSEFRFHERFRLRKATVLQILTEIQHDLEYTSDRNYSVSPVNQLLITLRFYATGAFQLLIADLFGVTKSTVCRTIHKVSRILAKYSQKFIKFPDTNECRKATVHEFYQNTGFPCLLGAIDCTHVPIQSIGGNISEMYRNRKGFFSINVQLVCDKKLIISDVVARWPGSTHDATIFDHSNLRSKFENGVIPDGYALIGDGGYPCRKYLMTPLVNPTTPSEIAYNEAHVQARNCIERANGVIKRRFAGLGYGLRLKERNIPPVIVSCVGLHNIARMVGDTDPPDDMELIAYLNAVRAANRQVDFDDVPVDPPNVVANVAGATAFRSAIIQQCF